ncbi:MAG: gephyrin-like molybdotransferase Glp [Aggregatilineales bacterium]
MLYNVDAALERVLSAIAPLPAETIRLEAAYDRILAQEVIAPISLPPFANSSMDGFAVRASDTVGASRATPVHLRVAFDLPAGTQPPRALASGEAARIMTGAPLPEGADAIVPVEDTDQQFSAGAKDGVPEAISIFREVNAGAFVRPVGEDIQAGQRLLAEGRQISAADMGLLAAIGQAEVRVRRRPRVAVVSTGDELIAIDAPLEPGKIRDSNRYALSGLIQQYGGEPILIPTARDTLEDVRHRFEQALAAQPDIILSSAGVSVGAFDVVRAVLTELGQVDFWRVNLRPGKPLAYGYLRGIPFFGLPGNPVSAMVTFDVFVRPVMLVMGGRSDPLPTITALVGEPISSDGRRSYVRVKLVRDNGQLIAKTTGPQSSGVLSSMVLADGLLIIPEGVTDVEVGEQLPVRLLRPII